MEQEQRKQHIEHVRAFPGQLETLLTGLTTCDLTRLPNMEQDRWATLADNNDPVISDSLALIRAAHGSIIRLFEARIESDWSREGVHTRRGLRNLEHMLVGLSNHCDEHHKQISEALAAR